MAMQAICPSCFGALDVAYDYAALRGQVTRESIAAGPPSLWRYAALLPNQPEDAVSLGEGFTPLHHARNLGARLGLDRLFLKDDTRNPTGSFKDRVVSQAVTWAKANGLDTIACASTGNLAHSLAAYSARAGLRCFVFIPADLEWAKVEAAAAFGPNIVRVDGSYDDVNRLCCEVADEEGWAFANINLRPVYSEGSKTLTFETVEQLGWRYPDEIVIPVASGCQFVKHAKAVDELSQLGLADGTPPALTGAQAAGCAPVARAWASGRPVTPEVPDTIARSLAIGAPSDGETVLRLARSSGGTVEAAPEAAIIQAIQELARLEGIFVETAAGVTLSVVRQLALAGRWRRDQTVVAYLTGAGYKTAQSLPRTIVDEPIAARYSAFEERFAAAAAA
jgi:threonine synthase